MGYTNYGVHTPIYAVLCVCTYNKVYIHPGVVGICVELPPAMGFSKRFANSHCPGVTGHWPAISEAVACVIYIMARCWDRDEHSVGYAHARRFHCADYSRL